MCKVYAPVAVPPLGHRGWRSWSVIIPVEVPIVGYWELGFWLVVMPVAVPAAGFWGEWVLAGSRAFAEGLEDTVTLIAGERWGSPEPLCRLHLRFF